jgi:hypothetical protein
VDRHERTLGQDLPATDGTPGGVEMDVHAVGVRRGEGRETVGGMRNGQWRTSEEEARDGRCVL